MNCAPRCARAQNKHQSSSLLCYGSVSSNNLWGRSRIGLIPLSQVFHDEATGNDLRPHHSSLPPATPTFSHLWTTLSSSVLQAFKPLLFFLQESTPQLAQIHLSARTPPLAFPPPCFSNHVLHRSLLKQEIRLNRSGSTVSLQSQSQHTARERRQSCIPALLLLLQFSA